jgi:hypothetical protein
MYNQRTTPAFLHITHNPPLSNSQNITLQHTATQHQTSLLPIFPALDTEAELNFVSLMMGILMPETF